MIKSYVACDIEVSPNAYLIGFKHIKTNKVIQISLYGEDEKLSDKQKAQIRLFLSKYTIITFNGINYDIPIILYSLQENKTCKKIFETSSQIVSENIQSWQTMKKFNINDFNGLSHIDISQVAPAVMISLKMYAARIHSKKIQDLPYAYDKHLTKEEFKLWCEYNINDLDCTIDLLNQIDNPIKLRHEMNNIYKANLMSKSDAQIAELVIVQELQRVGIRANKIDLKEDYCITYNAPKCINFKTEKLKLIFEKLKKEKIYLDGKGSPKTPDWLKKEVIQIGNNIFNIGIGGLHSQEKKLVKISNDTYTMRNADVGSYYPSMIIEFGFYPKQYGKHFLNIYKDIYNKRMEAKAKGDKSVSESLKLVLNGTFGKFGNKYSKIYSPELMLQVTITGQLLLLMLIEELELKGFEVVSSNTDGIEYYCKVDRQIEAETIIFDWELLTGMNMEHGIYKGLYARDVNNYVAIYDGYVKGKGCYIDTSIPIPLPRKNREHDIVYNAVKEFLLNKTPLKDTIMNCKDVRQFIICKKVTGGGKWRGDYLGKVVRWYYSINGDPILYVKNDNKVGKSDNAKPLMELPKNNKIPNDLDFDYYIELANGHLKNTGY